MENWLKLRFLFYFLLSYIFFVVMLFSFKEVQMQIFQDNAQNMAKTIYTSIIQEHQKHAETLFESVINKPEILQIIQQSYLSEEEKKLSRQKLYERLRDFYTNMHSFSLKQLHFHLKNNESFLRFHRPNKFGDDLTNIRETVRYVNQTHSSIESFEEGRIFNGYRFVFPLKYNNEYLGSVETSVSMQSILQEIQRLLQINHNRVSLDFVIKKEVVFTKVFQNELDNYITSLFDADFLHESSARLHATDGLIEILSRYRQKYPQEYAQNIAERKDFSFICESLDASCIVTFLGVRNKITQELPAYIIIAQDNPQIDTLQNLFTIVIVIGFFVLAVLFVFMYSLKSRNHKIEKYNKYLQKLLDEQKNILILFDGDTIEFVNSQFLNFFGVDSLDMYGHQSQKLLDMFIEDDAFFHAKKLKSSTKWIDRLFDVSKTDRFVKILDIDRVEHVFALHVNALGDERYLLSMTDVSDKMNQYLELEKRVIVEEMMIAEAKSNAMSEMIAMIAHQWRQPLAIIGLLSNNLTLNLSMEECQKDDVLEALRNIDEEVQKLSTLIQNFSDLNSSSNLLQSDVDINETIQYALNLRNKELEEEGICVTFEKADIPLLETYPQNLVQICFNLLSNSIESLHKSTNPDKQIHIVSLYDEDKAIRILFEDNGIGIDEQYKALIYDPYFTTKEQYNGAGLGLYIIKMILKKYFKGSICLLKSNAGAKFELTLRP